MSGRRGSRGEVHWVEVFKDRVAEDLKAVIQDNMDWTTSQPILNLLNELEKVEDERGARDRRAGHSPSLPNEEQTLRPTRSP